MGMLQLYLPALAEPTEVNEAERTLDVVITARRLDRDGDIVEPAGLDFAEYLKNPVVLWAHALDRPPVGRVLAVRVEDERVTATVQFADTPTGRELFDLYRMRYCSGWSIGFIPRETVPLDGPDGRGVRIISAEIVELSAVPVPSNPDALTRGYGQTLRRPSGEGGSSEIPATVRPACGTSGSRAAVSGASPQMPFRPGIPARKAMDAAFRRACKRMREEIVLAVRRARGTLDPVL